MNARIDAQLIPDGICAFDMQVAHWLNGSHSYSEDLHSVIRKFASKLNHCYFLVLDRKTRKLLKSLYPDVTLFSEKDKCIVLINLLDMMPARINQLSEENHCVAMSEEVVLARLKASLLNYLKIGDSDQWNWFCRWLLISYGLWATKTGFIKDLRKKYGKDFFLRRDLFGDMEFWENIKI